MQDDWWMLRLDKSKLNGCGFVVITLGADNGSYVAQTVGGKVAARCAPQLEAARRAANVLLAPLRSPRLSSCRRPTARGHTSAPLSSRKQEWTEVLQRVSRMLTEPPVFTRQEKQQRRARNLHECAKSGGWAHAPGAHVQARMRLQLCPPPSHRRASKGGSISMYGRPARAQLAFSTMRGPTLSPVVERGDERGG